MGTLLYRSLLLVVVALAGMTAGPAITSFAGAREIGFAAGIVLVALALLAERSVRRTQPSLLLGGTLGVLAAAAIVFALRFALGLEGPWMVWGGVLLIAGHIGFNVGSRAIRSFRFASGKDVVGASLAPKLLDTSAIIDGRIADLVELGFVGGPIEVPQFVLNEVQGIADSTDPLRRARGRRGLGILEKLQGMEGVEIHIVDQDFQRAKEVDQKLIALAKSKGATLITTDFNLAKVAELQGILVLNVHQLSQVLRPVVLPGEQVRVTIQKEGKEPGQGVGYLEDGTMVVVEEGVIHMGQSVETVVTSVLQTSAGRMIFTQAPNTSSEEEPKEKRRVWRRR